MDLGFRYLELDDAADMHHLLELGVDGIMTDRPSVLREVMVSRGEWGGGDPRAG